MKRASLILLILFLAGSATAQSYRTDSTQDWAVNGSLSNTKAELGFLKLQNENVTIDWQKKPPAHFNSMMLFDVESHSSEDFVYSAGPAVHGYNIAKWDAETGDNVWNSTWSNGWSQRLEVTSNFVYAIAPSSDAVKKLDKSTGAVLDEYQVNANPRDLTVDNGKLFVVDDTDMVKRFDLSNPSTIEEQYSSSDSGVRAIDVDSAGDVYVGSQTHVTKYNFDLDTIKDQKGTDRIQEIVVGPDGFVYYTEFDGDDPNIFKTDTNFNIFPGWPYDPNTDPSVIDRPGDIDVGPAGNVYLSTTNDDDATYKIDPDGTEIWRFQDNESQEGVEHYKGGAISAGKYENAGTGPSKLITILEAITQNHSETAPTSTGLQ